MSQVVPVPVRALTDMELIEFRRRYDAATAALKQARAQWKRLDEIDARMKERAESAWRKVEIALFLGGGVLHWFLADGEKLDFNAGTWLMIVAGWTYLIYQVDLIYLAREKDSLAASNAYSNLHWASALGNDSLFWQFRNHDRKGREAGGGISDEAWATLEKEEKEIWAGVHEQLRYRASGKA